MIAEKTSDRGVTPKTKAAGQGNKSQDEFDKKRKMIREKAKATRVNYVIKDLPLVLIFGTVSH